VNRKVHAGFGPADGGSTLRKLAASTPSDWYVCAFQYQELDIGENHINNIRKGRSSTA
jgi:hypothetical protein